MILTDAYNMPFLLRIDTTVLVSILFILMMVFIGLGSSVARRRFHGNADDENPANSTVYGAVFGLLAFVLAFTFSMSGSRFDSRRQASVAEGNAIGTAILRADLYPDSERVAFREDLRQYLAGRITSITAGTDIEKIKDADEQTAVHAANLWKRAVAFSRTNPNVVISGQMIPALNEMFDSATTNTFSERMRVPQSIVAMLFLLSMISAFFVGYLSVGKGRFDWLIGTGFCLLSALVIFITLDLDRPRRGLIQLDTSHDAIISLMQQFGEGK